MLTGKKNIPTAHKAALTIGATIFWYLFAHGYRFSNNMFSHDSLLQIRSEDSAWQISLGRFAQPFLIFLRGNLGSPWLISFCALLWLCLSVGLVTDLLEVKRPLSILLTSGIMVCNATLTCANAAFLQWVDFFALALFLSLLGVWLCRKGTLACAGMGVAALIVSMGIYQAYICTAIVLFLFLLIRDALENTDRKKYIRSAAFSLGALVLAALLYYLIWQIFLKAFGFEAADTYNGMASLGDYSETSVFSLIGLTYWKVFSYFWNPEIFTTMTFRGISMNILWNYILRIVNICVAASLLYHLAVLNLQKKTLLWQRIVQVVLLLLLPAGMNFVCIMSKGMLHTLMVYAFWFLYLFAVSLADANTPDENRKAIRPGRAVVLFSVLCILWSNIVYANQVYLKKELQERAVSSLLTRIVSDVEHVEGYLPGQTPVAFCGSFEASPCLQQLDGFEDLLPYGMGKTSLTYIGTDYAFLTYEMSVAMNLTRVEADDQRISDMPAYPAQGSVAYIDDVLVVKISEQ